MLGRGKVTVFQLRSPMPPQIEDGSAVSRYVAPENVPTTEIDRWIRAGHSRCKVGPNLGPWCLTKRKLVKARNATISAHRPAPKGIIQTIALRPLVRFAPSE
jgi:hypothetical protein